MSHDEPYLNREIDEKFSDAVQAVKILENKLLDERIGILPKVLRQTTEHNHRMTKIERTLLIVGTVVGVLLITNGSELLSFLKSII